VLVFTSPKGAGFSWSIEIEPDEGYIENEFPGVIQKIYERKKQGISEQNAGNRNVEGIQEVKFDFFPTSEEKYIARESENLEAMEKTKRDLGLETGDAGEFLWRMLKRIRTPKRFILNLGTLHQRTLELFPKKGAIDVREKTPRRNMRVWTLDAQGKISAAEGTSAADLKQLLRDFAEDIKSRITTGELKRGNTN
jgi:hypothetical protein